MRPFLLYTRELFLVIFGMSVTEHDAREISELFHKLWTKAVGTENYDKSQWIQLENLLHEFFKNAGIPAGWGS